jgi:SAM-dependent methyltransferase
VLDLNRPLPAALCDRFDLVYDGGTMEHCFSVADVLGNVVRLAKTGGRIIHHLPLNNWVDHGFYQFSPTLFFDFYEANGFRDLAMKLHFSARGKETYISYDPHRDGRLPYSLGGKTQVLLFFSAVKGAAIGEIAFPLQGRYRATFGDRQLSKPRGELLPARRSRRAASFGAPDAADQRPSRPFSLPPRF